MVLENYDVSRFHEFVTKLSRKIHALVLAAVDGTKIMKPMWKGRAKTNPCLTYLHIINKSPLIHPLFAFVFADTVHSLKSSCHISVSVFGGKALVVSCCF